MKKVSQAILLAWILVVSSCSDETTVFEDTLQDDVSLEDNQATLTSSINFDNAGVLDIFDEDVLTGKTSKNSANAEAGDYPLTLVAQVDAPSFGNITDLGATHVFLDNNYAYVSYNTVNSGYAGAIDIINVSDPNDPRVTGRLYYTNADVNSVTYDNGFVYAVGGVDSELSATATSNSFVAKIPVSGGIFNISAGITYGFQEGFTANDVRIKGNEVLVTSGKDGFITSYDKNTLEALNEVPFSDLRSVAVMDNMIAVLDASSGVKVLDENLNTTNEIAINSDFGASAKRTLDFMNTNILVSEGSKGAGIYSGGTGEFIEYIPILVDPEGVDSGDVVTNAVAANENIILMANGGAGLSLTEGTGSSTDPYGIIELDGSINYVASQGDYIFAASGTNGLQIVKLNRPDTSLEARCADSPRYSGNANLSVNEGELRSFRGSKRFRTITIDTSSSLLLCGSWTVKEDVTISADGLLEMNGTFVVAKNNRRKNIIVGSGAALRIEGTLLVYGDIILEEGATLEFIGDSSVANIFGSVTKADGAEVIGTFRDVRNKF